MPLLHDKEVLTRLLEHALFTYITCELGASERSLECCCGERNSIRNMSRLDPGFVTCSFVVGVEFLAMHGVKQMCLLMILFHP